MKIINEIYTDKQFDYSVFDFYFGNCKCAIFDIETTGLSPKKSQLVLSGFVIPQGNGTFLLKQIFAEDLSEERDVIEETLKVLSTVDFIVTYNGATFDVPFVQKRMAAHEFSRFPFPYNLDLYKMVRNHSDIGRFTPNLKQKTVENYMGLWSDRTDEIDGALSVDLYYEYLQSKDAQLEKTILLHNSDDVKQLYRLLEVLRQCNLHQGMCALGFPLENLIVEEIRLNKKRLSIDGSVLGKSIYYKEFNDEAQYFADFDKNKFHIEANVLFSQGLIFVDLDNYDAPKKIFNNCGGLKDHYLVLAVNDSINHLAVTTFIKYLTERICDNEL